MKKIILSILAISVGFMVNAQVSITSIATPYTQDFNTLSNDTVFATPHAMTLTGWSIYEKGTSGAVDQMYKVSNGSRTNGETYSYGDSTTTERALGCLGSGTNIPSFGVVFQNNTGSSITNFVVSYKGEQWRSGDTSTTLVDSLVFEYSTTATGVNDTAATWNSISSLMFNSPNLVATSAGALNGNLAPNFANVSGSISVLVANGNKIVFRWRDINKASGDDGLSIDDLSVAFSSSGNPKPTIITKNPADDATNVSPLLTNLVMTFDQNVIVGTGNVMVKNLTDATSQTIACAATTIAGAVVTIPGVTIITGKQYAVNFDSTCYTTAAPSANSYGIYDNTSWNFNAQPNGINDFKAAILEIKLLGNNILAFNLKSSVTLTLKTIDLSGKIINQQIVNGHTGENKIALQNNLLSNGIYFIQISNNEYKGVLKFEKQ